MVLVLFPSEPFSPREVDPDFAGERDAARAAGFATGLLDHTRVVAGEAAGATGRVPENAGATVYRGWMLTPSQYAATYAALEGRGAQLINSPEQYRTCHYLPESYRWIEGYTPKSVWLSLRSAVDFDEVMRLLAPFGDGPVVVKDFVKSQKHYWTEACFIPAANDRSAVERVVSRFLELQGQELAEGLVFRAFVPLAIVGKHPQSGMPLAAEFRIFWLDGEPLLSHRYWGDLTKFDAPLPFQEIRPIAARVPSRYFTMDVAFLEGGGWTIVELGDGQVAGLPSPELAPEFFEKMHARLTLGD